MLIQAAILPFQLLLPITEILHISQSISFANGQHYQILTRILVFLFIMTTYIVGLKTISTMYFII